MTPAGLGGSAVEQSRRVGSRPSKSASEPSGSPLPRSKGDAGRPDLNGRGVDAATSAPAGAIDAPSPGSGGTRGVCALCNVKGTLGKSTMLQPDGRWLHRQCGGLIPGESEATATSPAATLSPFEIYHDGGGRRRAFSTKYRLTFPAGYRDGAGATFSEGDKDQMRRLAKRRGWRIVEAPA